MPVTKQGVRDLNSLGPRRLQRRRSLAISRCLLDGHDWSPWKDKGNYITVRTCKDCGLKDEENLLDRTDEWGLYR